MVNSSDISKFFLINKPTEWTSFDVVKKIRGLIKKKHSINKLKVGHAGTLDPRASGLLILCVGNKTKEIKHFENLDKTYVGIMKIGCVTDSFDSEKKEKNHKEYNLISDQEIQKVFETFLGEQKQIPPIFSAIKLNGERLYKKARRGEVNINLKERNINIQKLEVLKSNLPFIEFEVKCSKGTYIRSLVNDIGKKLSCGAYLYALKRTQIGEFHLKDSREIQDIPLVF